MTVAARRGLGRDPVFFIIAMVAAIAIYFVLLLYFDRSLFSPRPGRVVDEPDGFEMTILALLGDDDEAPIWLLARYAVIAPMMWVDALPAASILQGLYLLVYSLPVVSWCPKGSRRSFLQLVLLLIPVFVSFRLAISIYSMAFCLIFLVDRRVSPWALLWYSFPVFLSSSTMFIYLLYFPLLVLPRLRGAHMVPKALLCLLYVMVVSQFIDKALGLFTRSIAGEVLSTAADVGLDYSGSSGGFLLALLTGNPFFTAIVAGQYDRFLLLVPSLIVAIVMVVKLWRSGNARVLGFVLILLASMLSEGVGSYSVGVVLFLVLLHWKALARLAAAVESLPPMKQKRPRRRYLRTSPASPSVPIQS